MEITALILYFKLCLEEDTGELFNRNNEVMKSASGISKAKTDLFITMKMRQLRFFIKIQLELKLNGNRAQYLSNESNEMANDMRKVPVNFPRIIFFPSIRLFKCSATRESMLRIKQTAIQRNDQHIQN